MELEARLKARRGRLENTFASHPRRLAVIVAVLTGTALAVQLAGLTDRPPGYYIDESSFSYNAWTIAHAGVDEHGRPWPLFFEAFGDWKTAPYIYLLAGVFNLAGPSILVARLVSAIAGMAAVGLFAWLGYRVTGRAAVALLTGLTALLTPWLFEPTRLAQEVALMPALIAAFLVALHLRPPIDATRSSVILLAGLLALITYTYTLGRLLGPLLALGLAVYVTRHRWRGVAATWALYGLLMVPLALFALTSPTSMFVRLNEAGYLGRELPEIAATFAHQLLGNIDPVRWLLTSDPNERHHAPGIMGSLLFPTLVLAIIGLDRVAHRLRGDPWSRYLVYGLVASLVPASLTLDVFHVHRLIAVPIFVIALTIPAQAWLLRSGSARSWRRRAFAVLAVATLAQGTYFQIRYDEVAPRRGHWFDAAYPALLDQALATGADPIYLEDGIVPGYIHGYWYGALRGIPAERFVRLPRETRAPPGAVVLSSVTDCSPCDELAAGGFFRVYRVPDE
jgi:hypothetical protein